MVCCYVLHCSITESLKKDTVEKREMIFRSVSGNHLSAFFRKTGNERKYFVEITVIFVL